MTSKARPDAGLFTLRLYPTGGNIPSRNVAPMPLTDPEIRNVKPSEKPIRLFDGGGLYLEVSPSGGKWWRLKYRFAGKEKRLSLGVYPETPLAGRKDKKTGEWIVKGARDKRDEARRLLSEGIDPSANRKAVKASVADRTANSFEVIQNRQFPALCGPSTPGARGCV